jgi:hypothetical protein
MFTFDDLERQISPERAATYLAATTDDRGRALAVYEWHSELTGALFPVVADVEIVIRNAMHRVLTEYHSFWSPALRHAFPGAPRASAPAGRDRVFRRVDQLHVLRNRLAHHEPVLRPLKMLRQPPVFVDVATIIDEAIEVVSWIDLATATWIESRSMVDEVLGRRP